MSLASPDPSPQLAVVFLIRCRVKLQLLISTWVTWWSQNCASRGHSSRMTTSVAHVSQWIKPVFSVFSWFMHYNSISLYRSSKTDPIIQSDIHNRACVVLQEIVLLVAFLCLPCFSVNKVCLALFSPWLSLSYLSLSTQIREELLLCVFLLVSALRWTHVLVSHHQTCSTKTTLYIFLFPQTWMVKLVGIWKVSNVYQPWLIFVPCKSLPDTVWPSSTKYYTSA